MDLLSPKKHKSSLAECPSCFFYTTNVYGDNRLSSSRYHHKIQQ